MKHGRRPLEIPDVVRGRRRILITALAFTAFVYALAHAEDRSHKSVLVLLDENKEYAGLALLDRSITSTLKAGSNGPVEVYTEYMDLTRFRVEGYEGQLHRHYRDKYAGKRIDLVMTVMGPSLDFALKHGAELFPGAPVVFCGIDERELTGRDLPRNATGILVKREFRPTLDLALRLHPKTRHVYFIAGTSAFNRYWTEQARQELGGLESDVPVTYLTELPMEELRNEVSRLPADSIILYLHLFRDGAGKFFRPHEALSAVADKANAPIYIFLDQQLGLGAVGGFAYSVEAHGTEAANIGLRLLKGENAARIPVGELGANSYMFDWRQLRRWEIEDAELPAGSVILHREPSLWSQYKISIIATISICFIEAGLIAVMLFQHARRRRAEAALRANQERLTLAMSAGAMGAWEWDIRCDRIWMADRLREHIGFPAEEFTYSTFLQRVHPLDREATARAINEAIDSAGPYAMEHRLLLPDGAVQWIAARGRVEYDPGGKAVRMQGVAIDVTVQKEAEAEAARQRNELAHLSRVNMLGELSGSLAHELNQPLTAILSNAQAAERFLAHDEVHLEELREILKDIVDEDKRAGEVISRLRLLLRKGEVQQQSLDVNEVVQDVLKLMHSDFVNHNVTVETQLGQGLPMIQGDRVQLQQVVLNLVVNGCDAMSGMNGQDRRLKLRTQWVGGSGVVISVVDHGCGVPPEKLEAVFEPFHTTKPNGMGLGLAVCRTIMKAHGGRLWATNNPARGATFHMALPTGEGRAT